jgi:S1-C subfamily serine protease
MTSPESPLRALSNELAGAVERAAPSIVRIEDGSRFTATGILWSADGVVVTTSHGVERDEELSIERANGESLPAVLVGRDPDTDLAVLRVQGSELPAIERATADSVRVGALALALGRPGRAGLRATFGIVSARLESQSNGAEEYILQTDATLYPGVSGGALIDVEGRMTGLINLMFRRGKGVALGLPIVEHAVSALLAHGRVQRGYLGVRTQTVTLPDAIRTSLALPQEHGLLIMQVEPGSPAEKGGLFMGDTLVGLDGTGIDDAEHLRRRLRSMHAGQVVVVRVVRGGALTEFGVTLGAEA